MLRLLTLLTIACACLLAASDAGATTAVTRTPVTETASSGQVFAELDYVKVDDDNFIRYEDMQVTIRRAGQVVAHTDPVGGKITLLWPGNSYKTNVKSVHVTDLDKDGEVEVTVDTFSGGAHCCSDLWAYHYAGSSYMGTALKGGSSGYRQRDLNKDGRPEWLAADWRFEYLFTSFADSGSPVRIFTYRAGRFVVVSRSYPANVRGDANRWWRIYQQVRKQRDRDVRGLLAPWAADECVLGKSAKIWPALNVALRRGDLRADLGGPVGSNYIRQLRAKLKAFGYL